jgi:hypothetical protein
MHSPPAASTRSTRSANKPSHPRWRLLWLLLRQPLRQHLPPRLMLRRLQHHWCDRPARSLRRTCCARPQLEPAAAADRPCQALLVTVAAQGRVGTCVPWHQMQHQRRRRRPRLSRRLLRKSKPLRVRCALSRQLTRRMLQGAGGGQQRPAGRAATTGSPVVVLTRCCGAASTPALGMCFSGRGLRTPTRRGRMMILVLSQLLGKEYDDNIDHAVRAAL